MTVIFNIYQKLAKLGRVFYFLAGVNIGFAFFLQIDQLSIAIPNIDEYRLLKFIISVEIIIISFMLLILLSKSIRYMKSFLEINLTYRVIMGFVLGIMIGLLIRFFPHYCSILGINPDAFKILGDLFLNLIRMSIVPLIFASITCSIMGDENSSNIGKLALKSIVCFVSMTIVSILIGLTITNLVRPGDSINTKNPAFERIFKSSSTVESKVTEMKKKETNILLDIVPSNVFKAFYEGNFMQVIFFAVMLGLAIKKTKNVNGSLAKALRSMNDVMFKMTDFIMHFAVFGIFGFTVWLIGSQDISLIKSLGMVVCIVYFGIVFLMYVVYGLFMLLVLRLNPLKFFCKMAPIQVLGYFLASSSAVLPKSLQVAQDGLGVSKEKALFIIPFGATVNMNGTALNLVVSVVFIAQIFGVHFSTYDYIYIIGLCTIGAVGTAPIPGASIFLLSGILSSLDLPIAAVGLILAIDRILDMARTFGNISGDVLSSVIVDGFDKTLDKKIWNAK